MNQRGCLRAVLKLSALLVLLVAIEAVIAGGIWYVLDIQAQRAVSGKLGIGPGWSSFETYIEAHFKVGMTRAEVIGQAGEIGPFVVKPLYSGTQYCEILIFDVGPFQTTRGRPLWICYTADERVATVYPYGYQ